MLITAYLLIYDLLRVPKYYVYSKFFAIIVTPNLVGSYLEQKEGLHDLADSSDP